MNLNFKAIIIGFIVTVVAYFIVGYFSFILGGLVVGYFINDDYIDGAINGAIAVASAGLLLGIGLGLFKFGIIFVPIPAIIVGLILGGICGAVGMYPKEQIEMRNTQKSKVISGKEDDGYLICNKCNTYYKLQPGESPEDFDNKCECEGKFKYYKNIDGLNK